MIAMNTDDFKRSPTESAENDREWQALRYVLGEMSPAEVDAFEALLATDQDARELVARSTGLVTNLLETNFETAEPVGSGTAAASTVRVQPAQPVETSLRRPDRKNAWAITGLAAVVCCCVAVGVYLLPRAVGPSLDDIYSSDLTENGAGLLVAIWSQRLADLAPETSTTEPAAAERADLPFPNESEEGRVASAQETTPADSPAADSAAAGDQMAADTDVPDWMVAALEVGDGQGRKPDGSSSLWEN
jgi:anti-sigma-K factor RskA